MTAERIDAPTHLAAIESAAGLFAAAVRRGPLDAPVASCPGWDVRQLTVHMGIIHRWARQAAAAAESPGSTDQWAPDPDDDLASWLLDGAEALVDTLGDLDPEAPTWHPFPIPKVAAVWPRRQCHETTIHRWDAENATGATTPIDPRIASDGIDEYFELVLPRLVARAGLLMPTSSLHVHCTDVSGEWLVRTNADGELIVSREHAKGDAALRGPAEALLLRMWNRPVGMATIDIVGDETAAAEWLALPGL
jgi:uncharacterized protein (TIGR03083 family)